jgi:hypothetical protein
LCGAAFAQDFRKIANGVEFAEVSKEFASKNVNLKILRLDLRKVRLDVHHAGEKSVLGTETTSQIAKRQGGIAAVNAGFFRLDKSPYLGDPVGLFVVDGKPLSEPQLNRIQLIINNRNDRTEVLMARTSLTYSFRIGGETFPINGINRERKAGETILYTPEFGPTTLANGPGLELVVANGGVSLIVKDTGNAAIPRNGYVISVAAADFGSVEMAAGKTGRVTLVRTWEGLPPTFARDRERLDVVAGSPLLVENGRVRVTWEEEKRARDFVDTRHPRTAAARLKDGKFLLVTADGRTEASGGLGLEDLAAYLVELGAVEAMNLDGGGSTTMYVNGRVVNQPSDKEGERKVSDALVVTPRKGGRKR